MAGKGFSGGRSKKRRAGRIGRTKLKVFTQEQKQQQQ